MKQQPFATVSISVIAAIVLWSIATWFEDDSRWRDIAIKEAPDISLEQTRPDTPTKTNTNIASCEQAESELRDKVSGAQHCVIDDDCTLFDYGYPIQCLTSVSKSDVTLLRLEYRKYEQSCAYRVYYDCPSGDSRRQAVCRNNRCEVDLVTIDALKEETLEYLGIE